MKYHIGTLTLLLLILIQETFEGRQSLQYFHTAVTSGLNVPEFIIIGSVNGEPLEYYDSDIKKFIPKTEWMQKVDADDPFYWDRNTQRGRGNQVNLREDMMRIMQRYNHSHGIHTWQWTYGCELDDDGRVRGHMQYGYDGEDYITLDLQTLTWTAANQKALYTKTKWDSSGAQAYYQHNYLQNVCVDWLMKYVSYGKESLERRVPPEVQLFQKSSSSPELVCHATGFFPKEVMMSWAKNGEEDEENAEVGETLPNQDGSFQKRIILRVSPEDLQKNNYTCVIQHSSLKEELRMEAEQYLILGDDGVPIGLIVGVVVGLLVLVLVFGGFVLWKKKNSGYKQASTGSGSELGGDSASDKS